MKLILDAIGKFLQSRARTGVIRIVDLLYVLLVPVIIFGGFWADFMAAMVLLAIPVSRIVRGSVI